MLTAHQCRALCAIADAMSVTARWQEVLDSILRTLVDELGYKAASIRELDAERRTLKLTRAVGLSEAYLAKGAIEIEKSGLDREALAGNVVAIDDVRTDPRLQYPQAAREEGIRSVIAAPLAYRDCITGVLRVYSADLHRASEGERLFLQAFGRLAARALIAAQRMEALRNISKQINSSLDTQEVLTAILRRTVTELNYKGGIIRLLDATGQRLELVAATGLSQSYLNKGGVAVERSGVDQAVLQGHPVTIYDVASETGYQYPREALAEGIRSVQAVPLLSPDRISGGHRVIGVLRVYSAQPHRFSEDEIAFLQVISSLGAIAIENARMYDALNRKIESLQPDEEGWYRIEET